MHDELSNDPIAGFSRRRFLQGTSGALLAAGAMSPVLAGSRNASTTGSRQGGAASGAAMNEASGGGHFGTEGQRLPKEATSVPDSLGGRPMPEVEYRYPAPPEKRLGWAIVGLGDFALNEILPAFGACEHSKITALVSGDRDKAREVGSRFGIGEEGLYDYESFDEIADNDDVDIVYIIVPNAFHADLTVRAARAGKHVLCEKPMAPTVAECERMISACRDNDRKLMIAYREQFEPHNLAAIRMIQEGRIGDLRQINAHHGRELDPSSPEDQWRMRRDLAGGGSLYDIGIYSLNAARYLSGEEPVEVWGNVSNKPDDPRFAEVEDTMCFWLRFPSGVFAECSSSYSVSSSKRGTVNGSKGTLSLDPLSEYRRHKLTVSDGKEMCEQIIEEDNQFAAEMDHMSLCVRDDGTPKTPGEEGLQDIRIITAIYEAAWTGKSVTIDSDYSRSPEDFLRGREDITPK
ncbi:hypothetical protein GCM10010082_01570 [Kushneria pakistanensis]|uniref:Gfo/Idh/MocA family oxidoreductase n=1 Tax=Kushneria pakistanensis TaxID=1508770 RepID=A0ABQ3F9F6_9GAMM|nr:Gfo/Idh/MocA family oxidoreductase [Kushneria pakistanensis]GHC14939.1 hypothetical protein GCM10010082_01570 [Kushneria pakistanensis]